MIKTISFTGSRPQKLWGFDLNHNKYIKLRERLRDEILNIMNNSPEDKFHFITGGALGFDTIAAQVALKLRDEYPGIITHELAVPFEDQPKAWFAKRDIDRYKIIKELSDVVTYVDRVEHYQRTKVPIGRYNSFKLQLRNECMVDKADLVIALYDGTKGGTKNCVDYAKKRKKEILIINPKEIK